ncbi:phosphodiester glycosidase family protein [Paenibacillus ginsengihumi]|uniref:phosphodiester glycosidase family protein n=1 Tax=Paenibacillus ginsengihumi TaxID=431596 RepID=UPI000379FC7C|nr:phosphodiester glycosidase family protein [Paenibacillus ginsengihumi]
MNPIPLINRTMLLAGAPFLGIIVFLMIFPLAVQLPERAETAFSRIDLSPALEETLAKLDKTQSDAAQTRATVERFYELYAKSNEAMSSMLKTAEAASQRPTAIFEERVARHLGGKVSRSTSTDNIDLKLYYFSEAKYNGYGLKVDLKSDKAMQMVLGNDQVGGSETTLSAAKRYGAVAGVNAGGYADDPKTGKRYPLSTTMYNGKYVYGFEPTFDDLAFVGMSKDRKLIGGKFSRQADLDKLNPDFGATFVPVLLQNGKKQPLPAAWQSTRAPRTVVGSFKNDQLLFLVVDGYDENGSSGATLAELQDKLVALGVKDAYNLDGGGSSSLVYEGQVINKPSDKGRLRQLPTHFLFFK